MKISKLEKEINFINSKATIKVEIEIDLGDCEIFDYTGLDAIPDESIPDILTAIGRLYKGKIKKGTIVREKVGSII